jgi:ribonucrease Y
MEKKEAREILFTGLKEKINKRSQQNIELETTKIICLALEKYSSELVFSKTTNHLKVDDSRTMGRIIGKDGRNINFFRKITGAELLINPENNNLKTKQKGVFGRQQKKDRSKGEE